MSDHPSHPLPDPAALAAKLPVPQPDEPESLRQDILDELNDHLQSAYDHELIKTGDNQTAAARVLDRFGDPAAIARQLWWDAMKVPAMRQMLLVVVSAISTTLSVAALGGLAWFASAWQSANTRLGELQRELAQNAMQQQADREALRQELTAQFASQLATRGEASATFLPLKLRVIGETSRTPITQPLSFALKPPLPAPIPKPSEDKGDLIYDFGLVPPGNYSLSYIVTENAPWMGTQSLWVRPGNPEIIETTYPDPDVTKPGRLRIDLGVPDDLRTADLEKLRFGIELRGIVHTGPSARWERSLRLPGTPTSRGGQNSFGHLVVVVDGLGRVIETIGCDPTPPEGDSDSQTEYWDNLRMDRRVSQPSDEGAAVLISGRYSAVNMLWRLPPDVADLTRFPTHWMRALSRLPLLDGVEITSASETRCSLSNPAREYLWNYVRWSGLLPATDKVVLPLAKIEIQSALRSGAMTLIDPGRLEPNILDQILKESSPDDLDASQASESLADRALSLNVVLPSDFLPEAEINNRGHSLWIGRIAVEARDLEAKTVTFRVNPYQKRLLERLAKVTTSEPYLFRISKGEPIRKFSDGLVPESYIRAIVALDEAISHHEPASQP